LTTKLEWNTCPAAQLGDVQHLLVVSDPSQRGIVAAERIAGFRNDLEINIDQAYLILNRMSGEIPAPLQARIDALDIPLVGVVPANSELTNFEFNATPLIEVGEDSPVYQAVGEILRSIL
jgi:CO dehydrogenase maturation factor